MKEKEDCCILFTQPAENMREHFGEFESMGLHLNF